MGLDRAEHALRLSECAEELKERAVIHPARMAKANQFNEGDEHAGEVSQIVRNKFGFIVAETTSASKRVLKQKVFFHLKNAPEGIAVGDRVTFIVKADPYSQEKMIAESINITRKMVQQRSQSNQAPARGSPPQRNQQRSGNGNCNGTKNEKTTNHRASIDNNWRRGRATGRDILHSSNTTSTSGPDSWSSYNRGGQRSQGNNAQRNAQRTERRW